jgi:hypothetical protein
MQRLSGAVEDAGTLRILGGARLSDVNDVPGVRDSGLPRCANARYSGFGTGSFASRQRRATSSEVERAVRCFGAEKMLGDRFGYDLLDRRPKSALLAAATRLIRKQR